MAATAIAVLGGCGGAASGPAALAQVVTVAGQPGSCDFADGAGDAARFNLPSGIAASRAGDLYVADFQSFRIRKVTRAGVVTTLAGGDATAGRLVDGLGIAAGFAYPSALAIDAADNLYVYDHCAVRRVDPTGAVVTLAGAAQPDGTPLCGDADHPTGAGARFDDAGYGGGIAVDRDGAVYVADYGNAAVRKIAATGAVTTLAGGGAPGYRDATGAEARFDGPTGVAVAADGTLYVADLNNNRIRQVSRDGAVTTIAGSGAPSSRDGQGTAAALWKPWGVALAPDGGVVVSENRGNRIRRVGPAGEVTTLAGAGFSGSKDGPLLEATFFAPAQLAFAPSGALYVVDQAGCVVRAVTP